MGADRDSGSALAGDQGVTSAPTARGQTTVDFAVGASLFLVVVLFVVAFAPGMFAPFVGGQQGMMVADRAAGQLVASDLAAPGRPYVLDEACTVDFFEQLQDDSDEAPGTCRFDTDDATNDLQAMYRFDAWQTMNVTVSTSGHPLVHDGVNLRAGPAVPSGASVSVATRAVVLDGKTYLLHVRVW